MSTFYFLKPKKENVLPQMTVMTDDVPPDFIPYMVIPAAPDYNVYDSILKTKESMEELMGKLNDEDMTINVTWVIEPVPAEVQAYRLTSHNFQVLNLVVKEYNDVKDKFIMRYDEEYLYIVMIDFSNIYTLYTLEQLEFPLYIPTVKVKTNEIDVNDIFEDGNTNQLKIPHMFELNKDNIDAIIMTYVGFLNSAVKGTSTSLKDMFCTNYSELVDKIKPKG